MLQRRLWLVLILLAAFAFRVHTLGAKSLWYDELRQIEVASHSLADFPSELAKHSARPLDYWLTHYLLRAGHQELWLRFPALLWGTLSVALMFPLARRWFDGRTALIASALMAAAPDVILHPLLRARNQQPSDATISGRIKALDNSERFGSSGRITPSCQLKSPPLGETLPGITFNSTLRSGDLRPPYLLWLRCKPKPRSSSSPHPAYADPLPLPGNELGVFRTCPTQIIENCIYY
jgi:hypothetical protein